MIYNAIPPLASNDLRRFWAKVDQTPGQGPKGECWVWRGSRSKKGYGHFGMAGKVLKAHRVAQFLATGASPILHVLHHCDNPPCVRPTCLFEGDDSVNRRDAFAKGRVDRSRMGAASKLRATLRTHCKHGHELTASNTSTYNGWRTCRTCTNARKRAARAARKDKNR